MKKMTDTCFQCRFEFEETSIQYNNRIKNNTQKICRECNRISKAEERAEKRKAIPKPILYPVQLMRKLKIPYRQAVEMCENENKPLRRSDIEVSCPL
jgi:hypothetical protein